MNKSHIQTLLSKDRPVCSLPSVVFWFGDLNFRIEDYDIHVVKCAIDSNKLPLLWERDQVRHLQHFSKVRTHSQRQMAVSGGLHTTCLPAV